MGARIPLRDYFDAGTLRRLAKHSGDANQTRRLLSLASIYDGGKRLEATWIGGVTLQIVRDWVLRFNAEGPEGLIDRKAPGAIPKLTAEHRTALAGISRVTRRTSTFSTAASAEFVLFSARSAPSGNLTRQKKCLLQDIHSATTRDQNGTQ